MTDAEFIANARALGVAHEPQTVGRQTYLPGFYTIESNVDAHTDTRFEHLFIDHAPGFMRHTPRGAYPRCEPLLLLLNQDPHRGVWEAGYVAFAARIREDDHGAVSGAFFCLPLLPRQFMRDHLLGALPSASTQPKVFDLLRRKRRITL